MSHELNGASGRIIGDLVWPDTCIVFAPLESGNPGLNPEDMRHIPDQLRLGDKTVTRHQVTPVRSQIDLSPVLGNPPQCRGKIAWVMLELSVPAAMDVTMGIAGDYSVEAWMNGAPLLARTVAAVRGFPPAPDDHLVTASLVAGHNVLCVQFAAGKGSAVLALAGPRELRAGDLRSILDDPLRIDPRWSACATAAPGGRAAAEIGSRRELFVDDFLIDGMSGAVERRLHHPMPREVVLRLDRPWEKPLCRYFTMMQDQDRILLYYMSKPVRRRANQEGREFHCLTCLAESRDGINFTRPRLGLFEYQGALDNNILMGGRSAHNFTPFLDPNPAALPEQRFKALADCPAGGGLAAYVSSDGRQWRLAAAAPVITKGAFDSQNLAFWDARRGCYVEYHRGQPAYVLERGIMTSTSHDFLHWADPEFVVFDDMRREEMYTNCIRPYARAPHLYLGTPLRIVTARNKVPDRPRSGLGDAALISSRDGRRFQRWAESFIRPGPRPGAWTDRQCEPAWGLLQLDREEISVYWRERLLEEDMVVLRRGTLRTDGFVSLHAGGVVGEVLTRPLVFAGRRLEVNYATSAVGAILFEICDEAGKALPGFAMTDSETLYGNEWAHTVTWRGRASELGFLAGRPVRLRVRLMDADLFALQFVP